MVSRRVIILIAFTFALYIGIMFYAGLGEVGRLVRSADLRYIPLVTTAYIIGITGYASGWTIILRMQGLRLGNWDVIKIIYSSVFFNETTPTAAYGGEVARVYFAVKKFGLDMGTVIAGTVAHRAIASAKNGIITLPLGIFVVLNYQINPLVLIGLIIALTINLGGWGAILILGWNVKRAERIIGGAIGLVSRIKKVSPEKKDSIMETVSTYNTGIKILLKRLDLLIFIALIMVFVWAAYGTLMVYSFKAMRAPVDMEAFLMIFVLYAIIRMIPTFLPEFTSSKEAILLAFLTVTGYNPALSFAVIALMRISNLLAFIVLGGITTLMLGFTKSSLKEMEKMNV
jgi:uncharacterized protein (TIRG00374 family)